MRSQILSATANLKLFFREYPIQTNSLIILVATLSILIIDLQLPLGVAAGVPYALVIFASLWVSGIQFTYFLAALGIIFTIIGFYLSPGIAVPINIALFNRGITLLLIICSAIMVIKIKKANIDISTLMTQLLIDPITGYKNRQAFESELDTEILRCKRYHRNLSVAIIDIDLLKLFSDNYDFRNKNDSIKRISQEIKADIRTSDLFYRIDINVFAVLFPETGLTEAKEVCEAIRKKISAKIDKNTENKITISIGIATLSEADKRINLCKRAEDALFISKRNGGNFVSTLPEVANKDKPHVAAILSRSRSN
ncbi:MAG: GGDEF domain-containing protein [Nitrosomonas sp.]|jgi:diguanylate cyclase (GGDEF)-like protein|uniref:GGDEF domain-containing protein n=1 Tax=Nitrosomonas sp. TaxID=42353 RepID=UPI00271C5D89|nr:GGDEF domain-containing protein [Nitrosomonas sp.]MBK6957606.1 GGDEF domain-containing protein [Nitrosomonas sp.]MDO9470511.1 GGDEF domain-containing protein [Nitrosomonas sp.]MDP1549658.1 GGDEF domain-containing protein [Nitrosomonas sp.]MDP1935290.1 GGDEF domain-containing protein [Nitrosomonas sp.]MDP3282212.1 GGDEF domain-containing protein [Nitrosomonas sp.]